MISVNVCKLRIKQLVHNLTHKDICPYALDICPIYNTESVVCSDAIGHEYCGKYRQLKDDEAC